MSGFAAEWQSSSKAATAGSRTIQIKFILYSPGICDPQNNKEEIQKLKPNIVNIEQFEYWNDKSGPKWVKLDDSMNERFSTLTDELFRRANINENDNVLDIGCGGGETSFRASQLVGSSGHVLGADISDTLLQLARSKY